MYSNMKTTSGALFGLLSLAATCCVALSPITGKFISGSTSGLANAGTSGGADAIAIDQSDNIYIVGHVEEFTGPSVWQNDSATVGLGRVDAFVCKINSNGDTLEWIFQTGTKKDDKLYGIAYHDNAIYAVGKTAASIATGGGRAGLDDFIVLKYDATTRERMWSYQDGTSGHDEALAAKVAPNGHLYVTGVVGGSWVVSGPGRSQDLMVARVDPETGSLIKGYQYTNDLEAYGTDLAISSTGTLFVGGALSHMVKDDVVTDRAIFKLTADLQLLGVYKVEKFSNYYVKGISLNADETKVVIAGDVYVNAYKEYDAFASVVTASDLEEEFTKIVPAYDERAEFTRFVQFLEHDNVFLAGYTAGKMYKDVVADGVWMPWTLILNQTGGVHAVYQRPTAANETDGWEELHAGVLDSNGDLTYAGIALNTNINRFETTFGKFGLQGITLPEEPRVVPVDNSEGNETPTEGAGDLTGQSVDNDRPTNPQTSTGGISIVMVAGAGIGAFAVGLAVVVIAVFMVRKRRGLKDDFKSPAFGLSDDGIVRRRSTAGPSVVRIPKEFRGDGRNGARPV